MAANVDGGWFAGHRSAGCIAAAAVAGICLAATAGPFAGVMAIAFGLVACGLAHNSGDPAPETGNSSRPPHDLRTSACRETLPEDKRREHPADRQALLLEEAAHQLRIPVTTIIGFAELLNAPSARDIGEADRQRHILTLLDASRHLSAFLADLADLARLERGTLKLRDSDADAAEIVETAVKLCHEAAERANVDIMACMQDGIELRCDGSRIQRAFKALITNAIQMSPAGSGIRISFERTAAGGMAVSIQGSGPCPDADEFAALFEPDVGRFGMEALSLPIARRIAVLHGGDITLGDCGGKGNVTRFVFPASRTTWRAGETLSAVKAA
jgi:signal transduction histidine kinase